MCSRFRLLRFLFFSTIVCPWSPCQLLPDRSEDMIDFAFVGGSFFTTKAKVDREVISKALHTMFLEAGEKKATFRVENFFDERELYNRMLKGEIYVAGVSHKFFNQYEKDLDLVPLVVPIIDGKERQSFVLFSKTENQNIQSVADLKNKKIASPMYMDDWFYTHSRRKNMPSHLIFEKMPESKSVVMATLYGQVDGGILPESFLNKFLKMKPHLVKKLRILGTTRSWIQPPVICSKKVINAENRNKIINLFLTAMDRPKVNAYMQLLDVTGYQRVEPEQIRSSQK